MTKINLAIVGASGLVGKTILNILSEENLLSKLNLTLYVSDKSAGSLIMVNGEAVRLIKLDKNALENKFDIVLMSAGDDISKEYAEAFAKTGAYVIDNTNAFRRDLNVSLVVPEINISSINKQNKIIANPNCSTIELAIVLDRLKNISEIKKVVVSTYQSVSGAGSEALNDLKNTTKHVITEGIVDNVVAHIGDFDANGFCVEEDKMMFEINKILNKNLDLCATTIRVPVRFCHTESVFIEFDSSVSAKDIEKILECDYIKVKSSGVFDLYECADTNLTYVCRVRNFKSNIVALVVIADNLRRGAAYNAVKIAEYLIDNNFIKN